MAISDNAENITHLSTACLITQDLEASQTLSERTVGWVRKHKLALALGASAASAAMLFTLNPGEGTVDDTVEAAGWATTSLVAGEALWIGGAAMMLASSGSKVGGFRGLSHIHEKMPEIAKNANESKLFKTGFWVNTTGAVSQFILPAAIVTTQLPPESWGVLTPLAVDFGVTIAVRKAILDLVKENTTIAQVTSTKSA